MRGKAKKYISAYLVPSRITGFQVKRGRAIIEIDGGAATLEIGAKANQRGNPSVTLRYKNHDVYITE